MTADPAVGFWLRATEAEGAVHEQTRESAVVLLPPELRTAFELPEEVTVTGDPEVAREDGALLLALGHPVLDRATERVLDRGDVGRVALAWPAGVPASAQALVERLRDQVQVDHGRIDATGDLPVAGYAPMLRIGALVTYHVTLDDRFQERQEAWIDADTGLSLSPHLAAALTGLPSSSGVTHLVLPADRSQAAAAAQVQLEQRAGERLGVLTRQSRGDRDAELTRVQDYYRSALDTLARRRAAAAPDRRALLDARADATRAECERRVAEVHEKFRGSQTIRWYRVHELLVPTACVPVTIRRGSREYPFSFRWLLPLQTVAPIRCPHCSAEAPLVAGKQRLGCTGCLRPVGPAVPVPRAVPVPQAVPAPRSGPPRPKQRPPAARRTPVRLEPAPVLDPQQCSDDGNRLALRFWEDIVRDDRQPGRLVVPGSPADVALRIWGSFGPALVIGVPGSTQLRELDAATAAVQGAELQVTEGRLRAPVFHYPYALRWEGTGGRPGAIRVAEIVSGRGSTDARLSGPLGQAWWRNPARARPLPPPRIALDPVARALWRVELPGRGPHLLLRCLAAWWRVRGEADASPLGEVAVAAALARLVAACAGTQLSYDAVAGHYLVKPADVRTASSAMRPLLALDAAHGW